jgi:undecaprenyl-diphosphatase
MAAGFAVLWLVRERGFGRLRVAAGAVIGLVLVGVLIALASHLHTDPRPFVQNPRLHPLIPHAADNGFPSDHSSAAGLIAGLTIWRRRILTSAAAAVMSLAGAGVAAGRVAAHVHHLQDVLAGLGIGLVAAAVAAAVLAAVPARTSMRREREPLSS